MLLLVYFVSSLTPLPPNGRCSVHYSQFEEYTCWKLVINHFDLPYDTRLKLPILGQICVNLGSFSVPLCTRVPGSRHGPGRAAVSPLDNGAPSPSYNHTTGGRIFWPDCAWEYCNNSNPRKAGSKCYQTILETCRGIWAIALHEVCIFCGEEVARRGLRVCWHAGWTLQKLPKLPILRHCYTCQKRQLWDSATTAKTANSKKFLQLPKLPPPKLTTRRDCYNCNNYQLWDTSTTTNTANSEGRLYWQLWDTATTSKPANYKCLLQLPKE